MTIAADHVNVNLGGHAVFCTSPGSTGIVLIDRVRVHVEHGRVHHCGRGIDIRGGGDHRLNNLLLDFNAIGALLQATNGNHLANVEASDNTNGGIQLNAAQENVLSQVTARRNLFSGVRLDAAGNPLVASSGNRLHGLVLEDNLRDGLILTSNASDNTVNATRALRNGRFGLFLSGARNTIAGSEFSQTTGLWPPDGLVQYRGTGIAAFSSASRANILIGNRANANARTGIWITSGTTNELRANRTDGNASDGIAIGNGPEQATSTANHLQANAASGNGGFDLADYPPGQCTLNTWVSDNGDNLYDGCEDD